MNYCFKGKHIYPPPPPPLPPLPPPPLPPPPSPPPQSKLSTQNIIRFYWSMVHGFLDLMRREHYHNYLLSYSLVVFFYLSVCLAVNF